MRCQFCQNWQISQARSEDYSRERMTPAEITATARARNAPIIAFTYDEPTVFLEYLTDIAGAARPHGIRSVMVSCGYMNEAPFAELCEVLDAIKIDLKGFICQRAVGGRMKTPFLGVDIPPYWRVLPPGVQPEARGTVEGVKLIRIQPGAGFGNGTHATTQLCLLALGSFSHTAFRPTTVLDFGTGSGILAIAAAKRGARVEAVEIDELALENARENARLNAVEALVEYRTRLSEPASEFDFVFANILRSVLLDFAEALCIRQSQEGRMILSGLVAADVPSILARYKPLLAPMRAQVYERGEWRAVVFSP